MRVTLFGAGGGDVTGSAYLLMWLSPMLPSRPRVFLTHGDTDARGALAAALDKQFRLKAQLPGDRETVEI
ncbi:MAG TPA: hypothetical protein VMJ75_00570 [Candidatus Acidoferrales bacterium]|nr:hypothetical protein [Candidatus Acidoferrales bacterium]